MGARSRKSSSAKSSGGGDKSTNRSSPAASAAAKNIPAAPLPPSTLWGKAFDSNHELSSQDALTAAHWIRQATGVIVGTVFGVMQLRGAPAIMTFLLISALFPSAMLSVTNELDVEEIAKVGAIQTEGMMPAMALFLLTWILAYTVFLPPSS